MNIYGLAIRCNHKMAGGYLHMAFFLHLVAAPLLVQDVPLLPPAHCVLVVRGPVYLGLALIRERI